MEAEAGLTGGFAPVYTYTFEKGALIKGGITGSVIDHDKKSNAEFYGAEKSPAEIVAGDVDVPKGNRYLDEFYKILTTLG